MTITKKQRSVCVIYAIVIALMLIFPPIDEYYHYDFIGFVGNSEINATVLLLQILAATIVFGMIIFLGSVKISDKKENK